MKIRGVMACKEDVPEYVRRMQKKLFEALSEARSQEEIAIFNASKIPATMPNLGPGYILKTCFDALLPARRLHNPDLLLRQCVQLVHQSVDLPVRAFDLPVRAFDLPVRAFDLPLQRGLLVARSGGGQLKHQIEKLAANASGANKFICAFL